MADPKASKKKKARSPDDVLWTVKVERFMGALRAQLVEIVRGLGSKDSATRRMSLLFVASALGVMAVAVVAVQQLRGPVTPAPSPETEEMASAEGEAAQNGEAQAPRDFFEKQAVEARTRAAMLTLGTFTLELKQEPDQKPVRGVMNMAEVEIVVFCDSKATRDQMEADLPKAQSELTSALTALTREDLMSREGKRRLKKRLIEKLNLWLSKGKVEDIYFSRLIVS